MTGRVAGFAVLTALGVVWPEALAALTVGAAADRARAAARSEWDRRMGRAS